MLDFDLLPSRKDENGMIRCYNMFPRFFRHIEHMTQHLPKLKALGMNVVWINPIQLCGNNPQEKPDPLTAENITINNSLYAMKDPTLFDPRFSVVSRDQDGFMLLTEEQFTLLAESKQSAKDRNHLESLLLSLRELKSEIVASKKTLQRKRKPIGVDEKKIVKILTPLFAHSLPTRCQEIIAEITRENSEKHEISQWILKHPLGLLKSLNTIEEVNLFELLFKRRVENLIGWTAETTSQLAEVITLHFNRLHKSMPKEIKRTEKFEPIEGLALDQNAVEQAFIQIDKHCEKIAAQKLIVEKEELKISEKEEQYEAYRNEHEAIIRILDTLAIQGFTQKAKELGITPIFDLVLNHLSSDAPFVQEHPEFFNFNDRTFPDATAFIYSKLMSEKHQEPLTEEERQRILTLIPSIIEQFWLPFVKTYIEDYGFCGVRVDCIKKIPKELRETVYTIIKEMVLTQNTGLEPVILEETLFTDLSPKDFVEKIGVAGGTHSTSSVYYKDRLWNGGLPYDHNFEDFFKSSIVENGSINFTGNHDHFSCAMTVARSMAFSELQKNEALYRFFQELYSTDKSDSSKELVKTLFIHHWVDELSTKLENPDDHNDTVNAFGVAYRDKMLTNMLSGSGGYYMLSGDEYASFKQPSIFNNAHGESCTINKRLNIFKKSSKYYDIGQAVIERREKYQTFFAKLNSKNQGIFLSSFKKQLENDISRNLGPSLDLFTKAFDRALTNAGHNPDPTLFESSIQADFPIQSLMPFCDPAFFKEINSIVDSLPRSKKGYWSELFKTVDQDLLIAVRRNGFGFNGQTDIVFINLNPHRTLTINKNDLYKTAYWFQWRLFPESLNAHNPEWNNPEFHKAYGCIMGSQEYKMAPANLSFAGRIILDEDLKSHHVTLDDQEVGFKIVVEPQRIPAEALMEDRPEFAPEMMDSPLPILNNFSQLSIKDINVSESRTLLPSSSALTTNSLKNKL